MAQVKDNSPRRRPYVYVTWITKLLGGENKCWWAAWFKVCHNYAKTPDDPDREAFFREWTAKHDAIVNSHAAKLKAAGYVVKLEKDAAFIANGASADVSGKPDLVAMKDGVAKVIDGKSGRRRQSDHWQVLIYLLLLPLTWLKGMKLEGEVLYSDGTANVRALGAEERETIIAAIKKVSDRANPPNAEPSQNECRYCDVAACSLRYKEEPTPTGDASRLF